MAAYTACAAAAAASATRTTVTATSASPPAAPASSPSRASTRALSDLTTVVLTTSPSPVHPSTEHVEKVFDSIATHAPCLAGCRTIVVCDGVLVRDKSKFRSGRVTPEVLGRYIEYKSRLRTLFAEDPRFCPAIDDGADTHADGAPPSRTPRGQFEIVELDERHGFGFAVRVALFHHVQTPLVVVVQHDRTFTRRAEFIGDIAAEMLLQTEAKIGYVLLPITSTNAYAEQWKSKLGQNGIKGAEADITRMALQITASDGSGNGRSGGNSGDGGGGSSTDVPQLLPCLRWYDSTHIAFSSFYRDVVFGKHRGSTLVKRGGFIEDKLGQAQAQDVMERGVAAAAAYWRMWLYQDGLGRAVSHLNGSSGASQAELDRLYPKRQKKKDR